MRQQEVRKKTKYLFQCSFSVQSVSQSVSQSKITVVNKMWSLQSLVTLKCESRASLHAVLYK